MFYPFGVRNCLLEQVCNLLRHFYLIKNVSDGVANWGVKIVPPMKLVEHKWVNQIG